MTPVDEAQAGADQPAPTTPPTQAARRIPDFYRRWLKKMVTIKCISGAVIDGLLVAYSPYDLVLEIAGGEEIILPKHSILFCAGPKSRTEAT